MWSNEFVDEKALAAKFGISRINLQKWRMAGTGPRYVKIGRLVRYAVADVEAWLAANVVSPTQE